MKTPDRAPRRNAVSMPLDVAKGTPVPGANAQTYIRKPASSDGKAEGGTYMDQRNAGKTGVTPEGFPNTKANK